MLVFLAGAKRAFSAGLTVFQPADDPKTLKRTNPFSSPAKIPGQARG
jgi:hypothetical protein